MITIPL